MFEEYTFENILMRMLNRVSDQVDKREGSVIYDALAPAAVELQLMYIEMENMLKQCFADTADRTWLMLRAGERGLEPYGASAAVLRGVFEPEDAAVEGKRFNLDSLNYVVGEKLEDGGRAVYCESAGTEGNYHFGSMTPLEYIDGLKSAYLTQLLSAGADEEDTEDFRRRYLESLNTQAFGGNIADYRQKIKELNENEDILELGGIGQVRVYCADEWNGGGTVKTVITTRANAPASDGLIAAVQEYLDPISGKGMGIAPVGHIVTAATAEAEEISVSLKIRTAQGYDAAILKPYIAEKIEEYFQELNDSWEESYTGNEDDGIAIVVSYLAGVIQMLTGIKSIADINVDGAVFGQELRLGRNSLAQLEELSVEVVE